MLLDSSEKWQKDVFWIYCNNVEEYWIDSCYFDWYLTKDILHEIYSLTVINYAIEIVLMFFRLKNSFEINFFMFNIKSFKCDLEMVMMIFVSSEMKQRVFVSCEK